MNTKLLILLAKLDQLRYPAGEVRGLGGVMMALYPAEYIEAVIRLRQDVLEELQRVG